MNLTEKDKIVYERLLKDLKNLDRKISKKQILIQFDLMYSKWFSNSESTNIIRRNFEVDIDLYLKQKGE